MENEKMRITLPPDTYKFKGPMGNLVYMDAFEIWLRGIDPSKELLRDNPTVMFVPIGRNDKIYWDFSFDIPIEHLDQVIETLQEMRIKAEQTEGGVRYELERRGLKYEPCGLNADWSVSAWHLSPGKANMTSGSYYLLDEEDMGLDGREVFSIVQRTFEPEDPDESSSTTMFNDRLGIVLDMFIKANQGYNREG